MASSLIYLIIIAMWVAYFLPRWMKKHDEVSGRNGERYRTAMKIVTESEFPNFTPEIDDPMKRKSVVVKRRRVFSVLGVTLLATTGVVAAGVVLWEVVLIPISAIAIYSVSVRRQVIVAQLRARRLKALQQIAAAPVVIEPVERISLAREDGEDGEAWIPLAERLDSAGVVVIPRERKSTNWEPVQVPRPTYVSAPKAITPKRVVDLTTPGAWSEEQQRLHDALLPKREEVFDQELLEQAAQPKEFGTSRAVND